MARAARGASERPGQALELHLEGMAEDEAEIPAPSALDAIMADPLNRDAAAFLIDVPAGPPSG